MKTRAEYLAYKTALHQLNTDTFVSLHACKLDVNTKLIWRNDELVEQGIRMAMKECYGQE